MKSILISIKPKWVAKILNGEKTIEIRKTMPKCKLPIDVYIYCTKDEKNLLHKNCANIYWVEDKDFKTKNKKLGLETQPYLNGKVVAKFTMYGCLPMKPKNIKNWKTQLDNACLTEEEYLEYSKGKDAYQWVIDDLVIFDKPKELSEFETTKQQLVDIGQEQPILQNIKLYKAPQSWQFIETEE